MNSLLLVVWLHFVGDFILQSDAMAINKSSSTKWLLLHGLVYGIPLVLIGWKFAFINAGLHVFVDFFTSRINKVLWAKNLRHWFFVGIGADQAIHLTCLIWLLKR